LGNATKPAVNWPAISAKEKSGLTLIEAALHYAPAQLKPALSKFKSARDQVWEAVDIAETGRSAGRERVIGHAAARRYRNGVEAIHAAAGHFIKAVLKGDLIGVGCLVMPDRVSDEILIPTRYWKTKRYRWKDSGIKYGHKEYRNIKIYQPRDCPLLEGCRGEEPSTHKRRRGAPGFERYSHEALDRIGGTPEFHAKSYKQRAELIKASVEIPDETVRDRYMEIGPKTLNEHYQRWRKSRTKAKGRKIGR